MSALAAVAAALLVGHVGEGPPSLRVFERSITTTDGVTIHLYRYQPPEAHHAPPVLLVGELGMGRAAFDARGRGLARFLAARGRDTFVAELRGQGAAALREYALKDWVQRDLPFVAAAIGQVRSGRIDLIVHGYGGTLALAASAHELRDRVGRIVALATPAAPEVPNALTRALLEKGGRFGTLAGWAQGARDFELLFARGGKLRSDVLADLQANAFNDLGRTASSQLLEWMEQGDLPLRENDSVRARLRRLSAPTLVLLPLRDNFAHPEFGAPFREWAPGVVSLRVLSEMDFLHEDYTHLSVLHGEKVERDVFEPALRFLRGER